MAETGEWGMGKGRPEDRGHEEGKREDQGREEAGRGKLEERGDGGEKVKKEKVKRQRLRSRISLVVGGQD